MELSEWEIIRDAFLRVKEESIKRVDYTTKDITIKVYRVGNIVRIDIKD
jgi:hypothetical protein